MMADDENGDEVKVFRRGDDVDDDTIGETSEQQLADDKKDAALETELEASRVPPIIGSKSFIEAKPSPSFPPFMPGLMNTPLSPFFPAYLPLMMPSPYLRPGTSPNFWHPAAMSPTFMLPMAAMSPSQNSLYSMMMAAAAKQHLENQMPLAAAGMRNGIPLNPVNQLRMHPYMNPGNTSEKRSNGVAKVKKEDHIKKPLNAFMWFMKVNRKKLLDETGNNEKQSAELNKELGKMWHGLSKEDQQVYFEMAKKDREDHKQKYPAWSARENYAVNKKTKKKRRDKSVPSENSDQKKCRARFGVNNQEMWCKFCKRKKKCEYSSERSSSNEGMSLDLTDRGSLGPSPLASSICRSPMGANASDSESDVEDEDVDPTISQQVREVIMQESLC